MHPLESQPETSPKKLHFIGIGGIGMSALAKVYLEKGWSVQGSNEKPNALTDELQELGAHLTFPHGHAVLHKDINAVIISSATKSDNPELIHARSLNLPILHRSDLLRQCISSYQGIAISGTHGKTTTTSLLGYILDKGKSDPLIIAGGIMGEYKSTIRYGTGKFAILEADESDKSHLNFSSTSLIGSIVTNSEEEHMENYGSLEELIKSFEHFLNLASGFAIFCGDDKNLKNILCPKGISYGFSHDCDVVITDVTYTPEGMLFSLSGFENKDFGKNILLSLWGQHNVLNATSAIIACRQLGLSEEAIRSALSSFPGVKRRLTLTGKVNETPIIDDYAHHPTEIQAVLTMLRERGFQRILAICQPHRYTRLRDCMELFETSFTAADHVILLPVHSAGEPEISGIHSEELLRRLEQRQLRAHLYDTLDINPLRSLIKKENYDVVVCMGAGTITDMAYSLPEAV